LIHILDPDGTEYRQRWECSVPCPNAVWHIDGYDKLLRYGIKIHECIDGFSRQISSIWFKAGVFNKNPVILAGFYIESIGKHVTCPGRLRELIWEQKTSMLKQSKSFSGKTT
jgi:hypothetical protein